MYFCYPAWVIDALSWTGKQWIVPDGSIPESPAALLERLLSARGLDVSLDRGSAPPRAFTEAPRAVARLHQAIECDERIGIFGDYDCDGITATLQMVRALERRGTRPFVRLPHRERDGYGLKPKHIEECKAEGVRLLFTVDTGIGAAEAIALASNAGIDVIILDHHHTTKRPPAYAVLHPAHENTFPLPHPSAAGVVFSFLHSLEENSWDGYDLDAALAAIGTIADLVELKGENRQIVRSGLRALAALRDCPLATLAESVGRGETLTSTDVAFRIAPRINAAGRMDDPHLALEALLQGGEALDVLHRLNSERQEETSRSLEQALTELGDLSILPAFLSVTSPDYAPGILGLIAGKLTEQFGRPSLAGYEHGELCTCSLRSPPWYNIVEALGRHADLLLNFGGHAQAAGATFALSNAKILMERLTADAEKFLPANGQRARLSIDAILPPSLLSLASIEAISTLEPFGQGNPEPIFLLPDITLESPRRVGSEGQHLQGRVQGCAVIGFELGHLSERLENSVDLVCSLSKNTWNGRVSPQIVVKDIR